MTIPIGAWSYAAAAAAYCFLTALLITSWRGRLAGALLTLATAMTAIWAGTLAYQAAWPASWRLPVELLEIGHKTSWFVFLFVLLGYTRRNAGQADSALRRVAGVVLGACVAVMALMVALRIPSDSFDGDDRTAERRGEGGVVDSASQSSVVRCGRCCRRATGDDFTTNLTHRHRDRVDESTERAVGASRAFGHSHYGEANRPPLHAPDARWQPAKSNNAPRHVRSTGRGDVSILQRPQLGRRRVEPEDAADVGDGPHPLRAEGESNGAGLAPAPAAGS